MAVAEDTSKYKRTMTEWISIVNRIKDMRPGFLKLVDTDHEYRTDTRNITKINGKKVHLPVDSLPYNVEKDWKLLKQLLDCYDSIINTGKSAN